MGLGPLALYGLQEPRAKGAGCAAPEVHASPMCEALCGQAPGSRSAHPATRYFPAIARLPPDDATRRDLDRAAAVRQLDRRGSFVGFERRFRPPWTAEETDGCFIVKDRNGQKLAYADERPHTYYSPATRHGAHSR